MVGGATRPTSVDPAKERLMTVQDFYENSVKPMPIGERLQLATLILSGIAPPLPGGFREEWSEDDYRDFSLSTWQHIDKRLAEEGDA
jgi:hypothetical protein